MSFIAGDHSEFLELLDDTWKLWCFLNYHVHNKYIIFFYFKEISPCKFGLTNLSYGFNFFLGLNLEFKLFELLLDESP